jgi:lipopolysaccharide/colanic/teichoic acid biosynthesis glycosyltransferase
MMKIDIRGDSIAPKLPSVGRWRALKAFLEFWVALLLLLWALPIILVAGLFIKWEDGGAVFYRRRVVGATGEFDAFKLRTMRMDADAILRQDQRLAAEFGKNFKLKDDPRVTRIGRFLRQWSLDELPQLFNVLRGEMSLVGPRMITAPELEKYGAEQDIFRTVKPGVTGYWQVSGRQTLSYEERVKMDRFYVENWSLFFDGKILAKTLWKVLKREGAY